MPYSIKNDLEVLGVAFLGSYTTALRTGLSLTAANAGGLVYDSDLNTLFVWDGTVWIDYLTEVDLATGTIDSSSIEITNTGGTNVTLAAASQTAAGLLSGDDKSALDALVDLDGVAPGATNLGTFTGSIIPNNTTIKAALQSVETDVESFKNLKGAPNGLAELDANGYLYTRKIGRASCV